jgi:hypothetical protein
MKKAPILLATLFLGFSPQLAAAQDASSVSTSGADPNGIVTSSTGGMFIPPEDALDFIGPTGGTATTSGFCIPGGLGCGPGSGLTPLPDGVTFEDLANGTPVPEPSGPALMLLGLGLIAGNAMNRRRKRGK